MHNRFIFRYLKQNLFELLLALVAIRFVLRVNIHQAEGWFVCAICCVACCILLALRELAWLKIELSEEEEDTDAVVLEVAEAACAGFERLDG